MVIAAVPTSIAALPVLAQVCDAHVRAVNTARNWAVHPNGGLSVDRPASCMVDTSHGGGPCLLTASEQGFVFRIAGGPPGWQVEGLAPTQDTQIQISRDGRTALNVSCNGAPS